MYIEDLEYLVTRYASVLGECARDVSYRDS